MNFDLGQLVSVPGILLGCGIASFAWIFLDKVVAKRSGTMAAPEDLTAALTNLQAELDANKESQAKVNEVHEYARTLEAKIQELESLDSSADSELRVKVLEKQLSEKADLESRLAIALQQLEDYKAKAEMYDTVMGAEKVPLIEPAPALVEAAPVVAESPSVVEEPVHAPVEVVAHHEVVPEPEHESIAAVASAEPVEITLVENELVAKGPASPAGATAPAIDERPALRVETTPSHVIDAKDPLEKIEGIGQVYQIKLYEAGIKTFAQLAAASPSRITEVIEPQNWQQIDVMKWRREAALFASGEKS